MIISRTEFAWRALTAGSARRAAEQSIDEYNYFNGTGWRGRAEQGGRGALVLHARFSFYKWEVRFYADATAGVARVHVPSRYHVETVCRTKRMPDLATRTDLTFDSRGLRLYERSYRMMRVRVKSELKGRETGGGGGERRRKSTCSLLISNIEM